MNAGRSSTELYHVPLKAPSVVFGGDQQVTCTFRAGLLTTVQDFERLLDNTPAKVIRGVAATLKSASLQFPSIIQEESTESPVKTTNPDSIRRYLVAAAQLEWYQAKGYSNPERPGDIAPQSVIETYNKRLAEVSVEDQNPSTPETATSGDSSITSTSSEPKVRAGTRPYCRSLIKAGELDEKVLLAAVKEKFPDRPFNIGDVRGCLRNEGKLEWTARKGAKKAQ